MHYLNRCELYPRANLRWLLTSHPLDKACVQLRHIHANAYTKILELHLLVTLTQGSQGVNCMLRESLDYYGSLPSVSQQQAGGRLPQQSRLSRNMRLTPWKPCVSVTSRCPVSSCRRLHDCAEVDRKSLRRDAVVRRSLHTHCRLVAPATSNLADAPLSGFLPLRNSVLDQGQLPLSRSINEGLLPRDWLRWVR